ncbi:outer membrane beta-barrel protein [Maribacter sp. 2308TA10-17]|uniref:outer membrane beta-barrel protein n=1 Tax=Maribacter sp. 2308TA10-17 TaxID=3386276 RepID=UPI0039BC877E
MKKVLFTIILSGLFLTGLQAQGDLKFGATGGLIYSSIGVKANIAGVNLLNLNAVDGFGFYVGAIGDFAISEKFHVQPELTYASAGDLGYVQIPIMAKYYVIDKLNVQVGPQFSISTTASKIKDILDLVDAGDAVNSLGVDIGFGAGYDITDNLSAQARFSGELTNRYSGPGSGIGKLRATNFVVGVAYFF